MSSTDAFIERLCVRGGVREGGRREREGAGGGGRGEGFYLGISPLASVSGVTWLPGDPHGCLSADVVGCKHGASLLCLLGIAAVPGRAWGTELSLAP